MTDEDGADPPQDGSPADARSARQILEHIEHLGSIRDRWPPHTKQHQQINTNIAQQHRAHRRKMREESDKWQTALAAKRAVRQTAQAAREADSIAREERAISAAERSSVAAKDW